MLQARSTCEVANALHQVCGLDRSEVRVISTIYAWSQHCTLYSRAAPFVYISSGSFSVMCTV